MVIPLPTRLGDAERAGAHVNGETEHPGASFSDASFSDASFSDASFSDASFSDASFAELRLPGAVLVAHESVKPALRDALLQFGSLYAWARNAPQMRALRGRAPVYVATAGGVPLAVRHAWHGGLLAPITRDVYRVPTRAPRELRMSHALRQAGIPATEVLAYALYPAAPGLVRLDVATRYVADAYDFAAVLSDLAPGISRNASIDAVAALLALLSQHHFVHPDLNVKNILLHRPGATLRAMILDVDVMRQAVRLTNADVLAANLARLSRSMRKARRQFAAPVDEAEIAALHDMAVSYVEHPTDAPRNRHAPRGRANE